jgi:hypothetical protein
MSARECASAMVEGESWREMSGREAGGRGTVAAAAAEEEGQRRREM